MAREHITAHNPLEGSRPDLTIKLYDGSDEQVSIIIVHKDRPEYLNICLQSICVCSTANNYEIIVVDNGSGQDSQDYLAELEASGEIKVVRNQKNLWWSAACNKGVAAADKNTKYLIFMHCDVVVTNNAWMDLLINVSEGQESGYVGIEMNTYKMNDQNTDFISEWCMLMTRECWNDIGPWPEELPQVGHSFMMTINAVRKGHRPQAMKNNICHHYRVFSLNSNEWEQLAEKAMSTLSKMMYESRSI